MCSAPARNFQSAKNRSLANARPGFCEPCRQQIVRHARRCPFCAEAIHETRDSCDACVNTGPAFAQTLTAFDYEEPVRRLIKDFKFRGRLDIGAGLSGELLRVVTNGPTCDALPDALVPLPLHRARLRQRGFNQASEIARPLGKILNIPLLINNIKRIHWSGPQTGRDLVERRQNVRGAFRVSRQLPAHVAIVDDVMTSGASARELKRCLLAAGASRITLWVLARR